MEDGIKIKKKISKIKEEQIKVQREIKDKTLGYIMTALGLVAGLAWNDAIKSTIEYFSPVNSNNTILAKITYAFFVTVLIAVATFYLVKLTNKDGDKK